MKQNSIEFEFRNKSFLKRLLLPRRRQLPRGAGQRPQRLLRRFRRLRDRHRVEEVPLLQVLCPPSLPPLSIVRELRRDALWTIMHGTIE